MLRESDYRVYIINQNVNAQGKMSNFPTERGCNIVWTVGRRLEKSQIGEKRVKASRGHLSSAVNEDLEVSHASPKRWPRAPSN